MLKIEKTFTFITKIITHTNKLMSVISKLVLNTISLITLTNFFNNTYYFFANHYPIFTITSQNMDCTIKYSLLLKFLKNNRQNNIIT